ncbi:hypothetical protein T06_1301 [Trichinella sp. T6]|nr:hypothetical protein T06_1301 [Trichinella sp. T6]
MKWWQLFHQSHGCYIQSYFHVRSVNQAHVIVLEEPLLWLLPQNVPTISVPV